MLEEDGGNENGMEVMGMGKNKRKEKRE